MKFNYTLLFIIVFGIFVINQNMNQGVRSEDVINPAGIPTDDSTTNLGLSGKLKKTIIKIVNLLPIKIKGIDDDSGPVSVIYNNYEQHIDATTFDEKKDFISPNPEDSTEFRFIDENMKTAWSEVDVSQHPKYYTSDLQNEKINIAGFFNNDQFYHDNTSPNSNTTLPERCSMNSNNEVLCDYNNRLQLIPPTLISNSETNPVLTNIGGDNFYNTIDTVKVGNISGNNYQVWEYDDEKSINGGKYYEGVYGASAENETYMELGTIKPNYSF